MEETRIFRSPNFQLANTINPSSLDESWEEQAFAEDAVGALRWPPRSYSCSFCGREFRSAQALGGHMNVHRREKARSKQVPNDQNEILNDNEQIHQYSTRNCFTSMAFHYPSQVCSMVYNPNPKADFSDTLFSTSSSSRVSTPSTKGVFREKILFSPSIAEEKERDAKSPISWSQFKRVISTDGSHDEHEDNQRILEQEEKSGRRKVDSEGKDIENYIKADLSVSLNLVICHSNLEVSDRMEEVASCKRKRADNSPSISIFQDKLHVQSEVIGLASPSIDDLDLELRLGGRPRMN